MTRSHRLPQWPPRPPRVPAWFDWYHGFRLLLALCTVGLLTTLLYYHLD